MPSLTKIHGVFFRCREFFVGLGIAMAFTSIKEPKRAVGLNDFKKLSVSTTHRKPSMRLPVLPATTGQSVGLREHSFQG
jgi:hypothetical protein